MKPVADAVLALLVLSSVNACFRSGPLHVPQPRRTTEWRSYGNDVGGSRYSPLTKIDKDNVKALKRTWTYRHGDESKGTSDVPASSAFEATPILVEGRLIFCTPFNRVIALDPYNGKELWVFDPGINLTCPYENQLVCRGVSAWSDSTAAPGSSCAHRIFTGTNDGRLFAIDAATGEPCGGFGVGGVLDLAKEEDIGELRFKGEYQITSPPAIFKDLVVVGAAVADNQTIHAPSGVVRAFDARTGALRWAQDFRPPKFDGKESKNGYALGTPNVWSIASVDEKLGHIYVPTGNPAPDFFRGKKRYQMSHFGSSVVALEGATGKPAWHFQTVYNDLWDYDVPAQPVLYTHHGEDGPEPALAQATKTGHLFLLNRKTGKPIFPVIDKKVPQGGVPEEALSDVQPFPTKPEPLARQRLLPSDITSNTPHAQRCREMLEEMDSAGIFTPPSKRGSILLPGSGGGLNWSGVAIDPHRRVLVTNSTNIAWQVRLFDSNDYEEEVAQDPDGEVRPQEGTPYGMSRRFFTETFAFFFDDLPCTPDPWGNLHAIDLDTGDELWNEPLGHFFFKDGLPSLGGAVVTASGLAFISGQIKDNHLRAFDVDDGTELWKGELPAGGQATPMTYAVTLPDGRQRQFVVVAAGGNGRAKSKIGDYLVAFALPE